MSEPITPDQVLIQSLMDCIAELEAENERLRDELERFRKRSQEFFERDKRLRDAMDEWIGADDE